MLAAIDIGTNSVHMVVARNVSDGRFEVVTRLKETVRLGESGESQLKHLTPAAIDRGIEALKRCRSVLDAYDVRYAAVATSAVREAENQAEFIKRARKEAGIEVEVIAGHEEARLIHLGVLQALPIYDRPLLLCDIGGGSTELLIGHRGEVLAARSVKLGAIRMTQRFFPDGSTSRKAVKHAREHVRSTIASFAQELSRHPVDIAVGSSGTIENLAAMALALDGVSPQSLNGAVLTRAGLDSVIDALLAAETVEERANLPGIDSSRADIIVGGALILEQVMDCFHLERVTISDYALREGVLFDLASRIADAQLDHLSDIRRRSIAHLMEVCDDDPEHSMHVATLALQLFDHLEPLHRLGHEARELLEAAALLANVGLFIAHSKHHQHAYYVIRNSDHLSGFTDPEIELIAQVARYHRRSWPSDKHAPYASLDEHGKRTVSWLAALLRVAIGLDRGHVGAVAAVTVKLSPEQVRLDVAPSNGGGLELEVYAAQSGAGLLERLSGREVLVSATARPLGSERP